LLLSALISGLLSSGLLEIFLSGLLFFRVGIAPVGINVQPDPIRSCDSCYLKLRVVLIDQARTFQNFVFA
jgi:hypothetical protein